MKLDLDTEISRTAPDYIAYVPRSLDGSTDDTGNEHFLVFDGPDGSLMAVWTQSTYEGFGDQRIVFSRSPDEGVTWAHPVTIASRDDKRGIGMASWGFPLVSHSGRITVIYSRHVGLNDVSTHVTGRMACVTSDDFGASWSSETTIPMPRSIRDNPDPSYPGNWIVWQKPERLSEGKYLCGFTRWTSPVLRAHNPNLPGSAVEFMRFENLDDDPAPPDLTISFLHSDESALALPGENLEEPSLVALPDGRLFCVMRSSVGGPFWSISTDSGLTWSDPRRLLDRDGGSPIRHPLSPCPIYRIGEDEYILFIHNHQIQKQHLRGADHRRPIYRLGGRFAPDDDQPVRFSPPGIFMDSQGIQIGHPDGGCNAGMSMYSSVTRRNGKTILWYPERKFFLLGRRIDSTGRQATPVV